MILRATEVNEITSGVIVDKKRSPGVFQALQVRKMRRNQPSDLKTGWYPGTGEVSVLKGVSDCVKCMGRTVLSGR